MTPRKTFDLRSCHRDDLYRVLSGAQRLDSRSRGATSDLARGCRTLCPRGRMPSRKRPLDEPANLIAPPPQFHRSRGASPPPRPARPGRPRAPGHGVRPQRQARRPHLPAVPPRHRVHRPRGGHRRHGRRGGGPRDRRRGQTRRRPAHAGHRPAAGRRAARRFRRPARHPPGGGVSRLAVLRRRLPDRQPARLLQGSQRRQGHRRGRGVRLAAAAPAVLVLHERRVGDGVRLVPPQRPAGGRGRRGRGAGLRRAVPRGPRRPRRARGHRPRRGPRRAGGRDLPAGPPPRPTSGRTSGTSAPPRRSGATRPQPPT